MIFTNTTLEGAYLLNIQQLKDERGFFARSFCRQEFEKNKLPFNIVQCNISYNRQTGTLRGMHYQTSPYDEIKIVSCVRGEIFDVIIDLRPTSSTYCRWFSVNLTEDNYTMLYIPPGVAHGFQTMTEDTVVYYQMSEFYHADFQRGVRWDDPVFQITWPAISQRVISEKDKSYPNYKP